MTSSSGGADAIEAWYRGLQDRVCGALELLDGRSRFRRDPWQRPGGGGGSTAVLAGEGPLEKAAVNFSAVWGDTPSVLTESRAAESERFFATGISMIVHPRNPHAPTFHANVRYFSTDAGTSWFGGGLDLTPYYLYADDARHFHAVVKAVCDRHDVADHGGWKRACDEYFYLPHRGEARGLGGVFFDHLTERLDEVWAFQRDLGDHIVEAYVPVVGRRMATPYGAAEEEWHLRRRGRYAEFNLLWDRGTKFGLETGGRTESILASLPPRARWDYAAAPSPGTPEADLLDVLTGPPRDWHQPAT